MFFEAESSRNCSKHLAEHFHVKLCCSSNRLKRAAKKLLEVKTLLLGKKYKLITTFSGKIDVIK